jgi:hypothetical protein
MHIFFQSYKLPLVWRVIAAEVPKFRNSTFFASPPPDVITLQLCTPKVVGLKFRLYTVYTLRMKQMKYITSKIMY